MKHLISATLSSEAGQVWESWPKKNKEANTIGRSATLSLLAMIGSLRGNIATHRRKLIDFLNHGPPIDGVNQRMFARIIWDMNEDLEGSIHHDPIKDD